MLLYEAAEAQAKRNRLPSPRNVDIDHFVILMMENRSFDHYFGWLAGEADAIQKQTYLNPEGQSVDTRHFKTLGSGGEYKGCGHPDPGHGWDSGRAQLNGGFLAEDSGNDEFALTYFNEDELPFIHPAARAFTTYDRYFCSILSSTWPKAAVDFALTRASAWDFERDQVRTFGTPLGPVPKTRAGTNGIIVRHGYIVAEFGDIKANDPVYSVAKSFLSTVAAIAVDRGLIKSVNDPRRRLREGRRLRLTAQREDHLEEPPAAGQRVGGRDVGQERQLHRRRGVWPRRDAAARHSRARHLLRVQRRPHQPLCAVTGARLQARRARCAQDRDHGQDRRVQRMALDSVRQLHGRDRRQAGRIRERRHALGRRNLDQLRGPRPLRPACAQSRQVGQSADRVGQVVDAGAHPSTVANSPDYGYLWWLNTRKGSASAPASSFQARGNGSNTIYVDPENDIVFVWHWHQGSIDPMVQRILASITDRP